MPKIVDREEMQHRILDAAGRVFARQGFHGATIADIAQEAGLGKGTLYLYFRNKDALAEALVERHFATLAARTIRPRPPDTLDALLAEIDVVLDLSDAHARFIPVFFEVFGPSFASQAFTARISAFFDELGAWYGRALAHLRARGEVRSDLDPDVLGRALASMVDGLLLHRGLFGGGQRGHAAVRSEVVRLFLHGLGA